MARWEPNALERLTRAAVELFGDRGYDNVTVAEIAERAGLTKRTFFRYFADKREVLFVGQEALSRTFAEAIAGAPDSATPLEAVAVALQAVAADFGPRLREFGLQRRAVIAGNPDLQERDLLKRSALASAMAEALRERGVGEPAASLAAELGDMALSTAYSRWLDPANRQPLADLAAAALKELSTATRTLR